MYLKKCLLLIAIVFFINDINAQSKKSTEINLSKRLRVGDSVPEIIIENIENYGNRPFRISDLTGKLLILDFWGVNCAPCIASIPKMEKLRKQFNDRVEVVLVTKNTQAQVDKLTKRSKILQRASLPSIVDDTILHDYFFYNAVPTHVWIDKAGKVAYITDGYNTDSSTVNEFLNNGCADIVNKVDELTGEIYLGDVLLSDQNNAADLKFYSILRGKTSTTSQSSAGVKYDSVYNITGFRGINVPILELLRHRYVFGENGDISLIFPNRIVWDVRDKNKYIYPDDNKLRSKWNEKNLYSYELSLPVTTAEKVYDYVASDVMRYFHAKITVEKKMVRCLALVATSLNNKIKSKSDKRKFWLQEDYSGFSGINISMFDFVNEVINMAQYKSSMPIINQTGYEGKIDIEIGADLRSLSTLRSELKKYDLDLVEKDCLIPMLIVSEEK